MVIQLHSLRPVTVPAKTAPSKPTHAVASGAQTSPVPAKAASAKASGVEAAADFHSVLSGGLAAAGAASASARSAAMAAAASATAKASSTAPATSTTTTASPATAATSDPNAVLTAEQVFGANPWLTDPTGAGPNGLTFGYNPLYFATASTAAAVAQMVGGTVVEDDEFTKNTPGDPFVQQQPNEMVELPDGALVNPGLVAAFYTHGYPNSVVNQEIANEVAGDEAAMTSTGT
jgi:hypothetical protein